MSQKYVYQGVRATDKYLTVYVANRIGTADRVYEVKVPMEDLTRPEVLDALDRTIRASLRAHWEGQPMMPFDDDPEPPWLVPTP